MPTFISVRCPHCHSDQIVNRGKTARGTQRYLCQNTLCIKGSFLLDYCNQGCLPEVKDLIIDMSLNCQWGSRYGQVVTHQYQHSSQRTQGERIH